ncbi:MAG: capsule assembly Wzi family protein, partial [Gemmatimonadales bacterium]
MQARQLCFILLVAVLGAPAVRAQQSLPVGGRAEVFAGGELENYLRYLQTLGVVAPYPWGLRAFSPAELDRLLPSDSAHPWVARYDLAPRTTRSATLDWVAPTASLRGNSTFPYGFNDGPIWAGRGVTAAVQSGVALRRGMLSLTVAPLLLVAQNAGVGLMPNGATGNLAYGDGASPYAIDRPQRFGDAAYARLDPGQSTLRADWHALATGVTTANQYWGPASEFPIMLGNNAPGFPHAFLGTARPVDLWLLRVHGRLIWGRLAQSAFSPETAAAGVRFGTGIVLAFTSRWVPGLELGVTRFSHRPWPVGGPSLDDFLRMLRSTQGTGVINVEQDNQLATAFFRWVAPRSGFEVYGEYGRDDYNKDVRDFLLEPDHIGGYTVGFRKVMRRPARRLLAVRAELQNLQFSILARGRGWAPFYTHSRVAQGHTQLGQVLGSAAGVGGAGTVVAVESYSPHGRWTWSWLRLQRQQRGDPPAAGAGGGGGPGPGG